MKRSRFAATLAALPFSGQAVAPAAWAQGDDWPARPDLVVTSWSIWAVPAGTPARIKERLRAATERALQSPDVIASMRQGGFEPGTMKLPEVDAFIAAEDGRWGEVIRAAGIKPQ
jgi:hypothetical protein